MTDTYFDIFGQKSNAIFQQNNYSANTFHVFDFLIPTSHTNQKCQKSKHHENQSVVSSIKFQDQERF